MQCRGEQERFRHEHGPDDPIGDTAREACSPTAKNSVRTRSLTAIICSMSRSPSSNPSMICMTFMCCLAFAAACDVD
jgi:hypothetical protein